MLFHLLELLLQALNFQIPVTELLVKASLLFLLVCSQSSLRSFFFFSDPQLNFFFLNLVKRFKLSDLDVMLSVDLFDLCLQLIIFV